jgi:DNA-binding LacI/PurR family transcriptional regulator
MQRWFALRRLPCLVVGSCIPGMKIPSIDIDYRASCRHAGGLLHGKGHRNIVLILPRGNTVGEAETEAGLREAIRDEENATLQVIRHDGTAASLTNFLDKALNSKNPPTCCVVARALHVLTVVTHLLRRGKRIPQDIAVISRDDEPFLSHLTPNVTRYAINSSRFTRRISLAARQLAEAGSLPPKSIRLMPQYRPGESI